MLRLPWVSGALAAVLAFAGSPLRADDDKPTASDRLQTAIKLYDAGDYEASREALRDADPAQLKDDGERSLHEKYLKRTEHAITAVQQANQALRDAEAAEDADRPEEVRAALKLILENEFAPDAVRDRAESWLAELTPQSGDDAVLLTEQADDPPAQAPPAQEEPPAKEPEPGDAGDKKAEPGEEKKPEAAETPKAEEPPAPPAKTEPPAVPAETRRAMEQSSLVNELALEHQLLWQQAVKIYRDTEAKIRDRIIKEDFGEARRLMDFARQTIELNRRYASPPEVYEEYRNQAAELERFIGDEQTQYDERVVREKQLEIERREAERIELLRQTRQRRIDELMNQAYELRKERRYDDAIQVLQQVRAIDPNNERAALMLEMIEDFSVNVRQRDTAHERAAQAQDLHVETEEAMVPWHKDLLYPKNWPEIASTRAGAAEAAEPEANRQVQRQLERTTPEIKFDGESFEQVVSYLRELTGLNIVVNWTALEFVGIEKDVEVSLNLTNVKHRKALELVLDAVGAGETELAYEIDEGVVQISTKEDLSRKTTVAVYDAQDLTHTVPEFRGREVNLQNIGQNQQGGLGGFGAGGVGGGGGNQGGGLFGGQQGGEDPGSQESQADLLERIIELIQNTIEPESWRTAGGNVGSIERLNQQIIVTQTSTAHSQLKDLLRQLRRARALQVAIEARYITVSRNYLEQIGVDLDLVLNNGNAGFDRAGSQAAPVRDPATGALVLVPRNFSRLGFTPAQPNVGFPFTGVQAVPQPYGQAGLVPATGDLGPHSSSFTPIPLTNNTLELAAPGRTNISGSLGGLDTLPAFQMFGSFLDNIQVDFLLRATQIDRRASDLDAPRLVLFNGQRATFEAFIEQDYVSALIPVLGDNVGLFTPIVATALTGRSLDVQATVSADRRYVTMTIRTFTQVSGDPVPFQFAGGSLTGGAGFIQLIRRTTQQIRTTVSVPDGGTLLIGGLKQAGEREADAGVPILSRIPILKRAFSNTSLVKDDSVLLILIKPKIIIQEEAEAEAFPMLSTAGG